MSQTITIIQIVIAILLVILVLLQNKGGGLSGVFGGSETSGNFRTKRGLEKKLHILTIIFSILFLVLSLANLFVNR
ncbi:preprotein translocase subunit SecG [Candidatus Falkowbacteria bacterium]|jgi:protein translocase SecG subunit|nr:preprotein translocase subunit SecG [Candidatus Falkowbacteria bacterium]MBT7007537.1 preprotein translocase subunit SecG [Candidatus Falkowbacteria bacterium]